MILLLNSIRASQAAVVFAVHIVSGSFGENKFVKAAVGALRALEILPECRLPLSGLVVGRS